MTAMKFIGADIPRIQESDWRQIMYKKSEPGKQDGKWQTIPSYVIDAKA